MARKKDPSPREFAFADDERFTSPRRAAEFLNIGMDAMYAALKSGSVPAVRVGTKSFKVPVEALKRLARGEAA